MKKIKKYFYLLSQFFKYSLMADLEYRFNTILRVAIDVVWYITQMSLFEITYKHVDTLSGWTIDQVRVFMGVLFVVDSLWMVLLHENLEGFSDRIRNAELDQILTKPVNSQFMMSTKKMNPYYILNFLMTMSFLIYAFMHLAEPVAAWRVLLIFVMIPACLMLMYACKFFFAGAALFLTRADNIGFVYYNIYRLATRPHFTYPRALQYFILTVLPVAFIASVPTHIILGKYSLLLIGVLYIIAIILTYLTNLYWKAGLKRYASASS